MSNSVTTQNQSTVFASWHQCAHPSNTRFLSSLYPPSETTAQFELVQPFLHANVTFFLHVTLCCPIDLPPPKKLPLNLGGAGPHLTHGSLDSPDPPFQTVSGSSQLFSTTLVCYRRTEQRQNSTGKKGHSRYRVTRSKSYFM